MNDYEMPNEEKLRGVFNEDSEAKRILNDKDSMEDLINKTLDKLQNIPVVGELIEDTRLLVAVLIDYTNGSYKEIPLASIVMIIIGLLYLLSPIDFIPDFIPAVGLLDDAMVIGIVLTTIHNDLQSYRAWKESQE